MWFLYPIGNFPTFPSPETNSLSSVICGIIHSSSPSAIGWGVKDMLCFCCCCTFCFCNVRKFCWLWNGVARLMVQNGMWIFFVGIKEKSDNPYWDISFKELILIKYNNTLTELNATVHCTDLVSSAKITFVVSTENIQK